MVRHTTKKLPEQSRDALQVIGLGRHFFFFFLDKTSKILMESKVKTDQMSLYQTKNLCIIVDIHGVVTPTAEEKRIYRFFI